MEQSESAISGGSPSSADCYRRYFAKQRSGTRLSTYDFGYWCGPRRSPPMPSMPPRGVIAFIQ